ncbi:MAG: RNase H family protein [Pirellulaceae bacterium]
MSVPAPHFLLFSESRCTTRDHDDPEHDAGQWRFVLESIDGREKLEAADDEPDTQGDRLELLAVVRGLEALDQPSRVTLITQSRYVSRGIRFGLAEWRAADWQWERFGEMTPVKHDDLWRRVDQALKFHQVECRTWKFESQDADCETGDEPADATSRSSTHVSDEPGAAATSGRRAVQSRTFSDPESGKHYRIDAPHVSTEPMPAPRRRPRPTRPSEAVPAVAASSRSQDGHLDDNHAEPPQIGGLLARAARRLLRV